MNHIDATMQSKVHISHHTQPDVSAHNNNVHTPSLSDKTTENISNKKQSSQNSSMPTQAEVQKQIKKLNESIGPLSTFIKFGVDKNNVFFVSVIDKKNDEVISRFPAAKAESIIQKLKEPIGIIFDQKG